MQDPNVLDGINLQADGKMSNHDARLIRMRLRQRIKSNSDELARLIEDLTRLKNDIDNIAQIEFFVEDVE
jgi:hypothetical protein